MTKMSVGERLDRWLLSNSNENYISRIVDKWNSMVHLRTRGDLMGEQFVEDSVPDPRHYCVDKSIFATCCLKVH